MNKITLNNKGFGLLGILLVIIVLALAGGAGVYVYHKNHKAKTKASSSSSTGAKTGSAGGTTTSDPYAGWKTYTLATTGLSFKYPVNWTLKDQSLPSNNIYSVLLSSPNQLAMTISVRPNSGAGGDDAGIISSEPIKSVGSSYFVNYEGLPSENGMVDRAYLSTSSNIKYEYPQLSGQANTEIFVQADFVDNGMMTAKSVSSFKADPDFEQALLVMESLTDQP